MKEPKRIIDFSTPEGKAIFEREVRRRMEAPYYMDRTKAEMLVAALLTDLWKPAPPATND